MAEAVRFELTRGFPVGGFQDRSIQPLWRLTQVTFRDPQITAPFRSETHNVRLGRGRVKTPLAIGRIKERADRKDR